jgi:hypothetical protein
MATRTRWFYARVFVLLAILVFVIAYAINDVASRHARKTWDHTLSIAVIVVKKPGVDASAIEALRDRVPALEERLTSELHRYAPNAPAPFHVTVFGPIDEHDRAPVFTSDGVFALATHAWDLRAWTREADERANVASAAFDSRIYVTAEMPKSKKHMIEGSSEQGGRVGIVTVDLDVSTVDFSLAVIAHELFHTLDATDKYDDAGRTKIPDGLAEPDLVPQIPQRFVEIMTRGKPLSSNEDQVLDTLDDLAVGPATAREIGWLR